MKRGLIEEGKATLRMKQDMQSDNFNMYDLIAYRIKASVYLYVFYYLISPFPCAIIGDILYLALSPVYSSPSCRG